MSFMEQLAASWRRNHSLVCIGLDPEPERFPLPLRDRADALLSFCTHIVDATADLVCCYKPQIAHFAARGGEEQLQALISHIHQHHPGIPVILDAKRGDIGSTAEYYAREAFERYRADAVTLNPYLGGDSLMPFLQHADKGAILLCRTSNPGARDLQDLSVDGMPLYQHVARRAAMDWNHFGNCSLVVGATYPDDLAQVRHIVGDMPLLVPGIGAQGGDAEAVVHNGCRPDGAGLIISSSRAVLYASNGDDFAMAARTAAEALRLRINQARAST